MNHITNTTVKSIWTDLLNRVSLFGPFGLFTILILVGTTFRFLYPFFSHPLDHLYSDPLRHYLNATSLFNTYIYSWLDPPLPQLWSRAMLSLFTNTRLGIATYFGSLSAITPWCWYLWGRKLFDSKEKAIVFLTAIIWLPSWLGIFGYFMDETLLLPVLGIALWLSWEAKEKNTAFSLLIAIIAWAIAIGIKMSALFELAIVLPWLFFYFLKKNDYKLRSYIVIATSLLILAAVYLAYPLWVYQGLGSTWLYPPGMGAMTKAFYLSGAAGHSTAFMKHGRPFTATCEFGSNTLLTKSLEPFSDWQTWRKGVYHLILNCDNKVVLMPPMPHLSFEKRLLYIFEGTVHFFFSRSWPEERGDDLIHIAQVETRWIWSILTLSIIVMAWQKNRFRDFIVVLCLGTIFLYAINDSAPVEGRYRKPWEGIAIAAFIYLFNAQTLSSSKSES